MRKLGLILFFDSVVLMLIGLIIVLSASSSYSSFKFDSLFHLFNSHLLKVGLGFIAMIVFAAVPYEIYKEFSKQAIILVTFLLIATLFLAQSVKGAGRWINLGLFTIQPADIAKLILIIHIAALIESKDKVLKDFRNGFVYLFLWVIIVAGLIIIQPNVSNAVLLVFVCLVILYVGGAKLSHIFVSSMACLGAGAAIAMIFTHSRERIMTFISSYNNGGDINVQVRQAVLGLGSGGWIGVGMGHSRQSNLFLPEAYGDFIFAILGEETGFIGSIIILLCYLTFFTAGVIIAKKCKDKFGQLLAFGLTFSIIIYAFINIAVASGMLPTTGLPLPFISYGGTSIIFLCISVGILINIAFRNQAELNISKLKPGTDRINRNQDLVKEYVKRSRQ